MGRGGDDATLRRVRVRVGWVGLLTFLLATSSVSSLPHWSASCCAAGTSGGGNSSLNSLLTVGASASSSLSSLTTLVQWSASCCPTSGASSLASGACASTPRGLHVASSAEASRSENDLFRSSWILA
eukprot:scaffold44240_cov59-Phaeocystis_antarctica.AAC.11